MPRFPVSPYWSANPSIPIFLDTGHDRTSSSPPSRDEEEHICPTCETSSRDAPIHCVSTPEAPPSYNSIATKGSPKHLAVPGLRLETSASREKLQTPMRALQFDPEGRPQVRFRRNAFSPLSPRPSGDPQIWANQGSLGLGIAEAPFRPDRSPITPGTIELAKEEGSDGPGRASNLAQRIEQKLWRYSASKNVIKRWLFEIVSWLLSAACMAGIAIVLFVYKDKSLPKWPLGITLNAYVSVLSKIASAGLLVPVSEALGQLKWSWFNKENSKKMWDFEIFDSASRGPWGSFLLLVRTKGRSLAALGACVTIFALALDPFFQQVVQYPEPWRRQAGEGVLKRAFGFAPRENGHLFRRDLGEYLEVTADLMEVGERFFYDRGLLPVAYGKAPRADVPISCPSSKCQWSLYETLAFRSECTEVPDSIEFRCQHATLDWVQNPDSDPKTLYNTFPNGTSCGWWLKADDPLLMNGYDVDVNTAHSGEVLLMRAQPLYDIFSREPLKGYSAKLNNTRNPISHAVIVSGGSIDDVQRNMTPTAHECLLSWSIRELNSTYSEGGYNEQLVHTFYNSTQGPSPWNTFPSYDDDGKLAGFNYFYNEEVTLQSPHSGQIYRIDNDTHFMATALMDEIFPSQYTVANSTDEHDAMLRYRQYIIEDPWLRNMTFNPWMFPNISQHLDDFATTLTNVLRSAPDHVEEVTGPAYDRESIVDVRWAWLILPFALLISTLMFLVATIIRSSRDQEHIGVYKTSAIATLLHGLPDDMQEKIKSTKGAGTPRANAKGTRVKWVPKAGWRFSGNTLSPKSPVEWGRN